MSHDIRDTFIGKGKDKDTTDARDKKGERPQLRASLSLESEILETEQDGVLEVISMNDTTNFQVLEGN